ncbi:MAG: dual specificity protein phosphatase family protein [Deltaproteobacteria bacterium]|nr:dual specificity protein phosphatase family protein [Deltaproteobacteria bacterium]
MSTLQNLTDRVITLLGLDLDFSIDIGTDPLNQITEDLYLGARPDQQQVPALEKIGITHVVSCLREGERAKVAFLRSSFDSLFIPMHDGMHEDIASVFPIFFDFVQTARGQEVAPKIFVHCEAGVSRSATLATALLMQQSGKRFFPAYCDVRAKRGAVLLNIGFATQLQKLEFDLHPKANHDQSVSSLARYLREVCKVPIKLEVLHSELHHHDYDAVETLQSIFGDEIPRVIQGVRR